MRKEIALNCMKSASEQEKELCEECPIYGQTGCDHCYEDALQYVIGMLEQEPYEDCISRQAVLDMIENAQIITDGEFCGYCTEDIDINILPPVNTQPKTGNWIKY